MPVTKGKPSDSSHGTRTQAHTQAHTHTHPGRRQPRAPFGRARSDAGASSMPTDSKKDYARGAQSLRDLYGRSVSFVASRSRRVRSRPPLAASLAAVLYALSRQPLPLPRSRGAPSDTALPPFPLCSRARPSLRAPVRLPLAESNIFIYIIFPIPPPYLFFGFAVGPVCPPLRVGPPRSRVPPSARPLPLVAPARFARGPARYARTYGLQ